MAHADDMVHITQTELEQLVGKDARGVGKAKEGVVRVDGPQPHGPRVEDDLVAQAAQAGMAMDDVDALAQHDDEVNRRLGIIYCVKFPLMDSQ